MPYKIRSKTTGKYLNGKNSAWTKNGKVWNTMGNLKLFLNQYCSPSNLKAYQDLEIEEFTDPIQHPFMDIAHSRMLSSLIWDKIVKWHNTGRSSNRTYYHTNVDLTNFIEKEMKQYQYVSVLVFRHDYHAQLAKIQEQGSCSNILTGSGFMMVFHQELPGVLIKLQFDQLALTLAVDDLNSELGLRA